MLDSVRNLRRAGPAERFWWFQRMRSKLFTRYVSRSFAEFGEGSIIWLPVVIWGARNISIGRGVKIAENARISTGEHGRISIGDRTHAMGDLTVHAYDSVTIGADCGIARRVTILDYQQNIDPGVAPLHAGHVAKPVVIEDGVWLGTGVVVQAGVTIGRNAVVGSNAVVTRDVAAGQVVAGIPARPLR